MEKRVQFWRVEKEIFSATARTGEGARLSGGRWNSPGLPAIYCGQSLALSVLEILVHAVTPEERSDPRVWFRLTSRADIRTVRPTGLPKGWNDPVIHPATVALGDSWLRGRKSVGLRVPSAVIPGEWNYILNPLHPQFRKLVRWSRPVVLEIDKRLVDGAPVLPWQ
jgi:RES domain-containing protein